jgi:hypothetical protein
MRDRRALALGALMWRCLNVVTVLGVPGALTARAGADQSCLPEACNGRDDDCDGRIDEEEDLFPCAAGAAGACPPACGSQVGQCRAGTLRCQGGVVICAGKVAAVAETCDGKDNDCNSIIDGFSRPCYAALVAGCNPATGVCTGICRLGAEHCPRLLAPADGNDFGFCVGAVIPQREVCNDLDDDCNGVVDDVLGGCQGICVARAETCNGEDDDCDGIVDEGVVGDGAACAQGFDLALAGRGDCRAGVQRCLAGAFRCQESVGPAVEVCDGKDNDCDGVVDTGTSCPPSYQCQLGACQPICGPAASGCAADRICADPTGKKPCTGSDRQGCVCLPSPCLRDGNCPATPDKDGPYSAPERPDASAPCAEDGGSCPPGGSFTADGCSCQLAGAPAASPSVAPTVLALMILALAGGCRLWRRRRPPRGAGR